MDGLIVLMGIVFLGLLGGGAYIFLKEPQGAVSQEKIQTNQPSGDLSKTLEKKIAAHEEKVKNFQSSIETLQQELDQSKEKERALIKERSQIAFDSQEYEKFKKDFQVLKSELNNKEEILEQEISQKRQVASELAQVKTELDGIKKRVIESEDSFRKAQTANEILTKELTLAKKTIEEQKKIVGEHTENKMEGEWVSRVEFNKIERELREKEALIQKYLSLKKDPSP